MKTLIAIITYRRLHALEVVLEGLNKHCPEYDLAVFEDCGNRDGTSLYLAKGPCQPREDLMADEYDHFGGYRAFLGRVNLGVAGNSNRALRVFELGEYDHICLMNDDLHVLGDFPAFYAKAHKDLGVGLFCFNDFWESETHRWVTVRSRGYRLKLFPRYTGIMMSITRELFSKIGYYDTRMGFFGEEHCEITNRARFAGGINLDGQPQTCLDVEPTLPDGRAGPPLLKHQDVATSVAGQARTSADIEANVRMMEASARYRHDHYYCPFRLTYPRLVGGMNNVGIMLEDIPGYAVASSA